MTKTYTPNDVYPHPVLGGECQRYDFANGYTASVVRHSGSYGYSEGLWELAVMHNDKLVYDTPITDDVLGHLTESEVQDTLARIEQLPPRANNESDSA